MPERKIGIYGGSFSPPHEGHLHAARVFLEQCALTELYIIPAYRSPGKEEDGGATAEQRLQMCRLAFAELPRTRVCDLEIRRRGESYTKDTLKALSAPHTQLIMLLGTDTALALDSWRCPEQLFALTDFVCVRRESDPDFTQRLSQKNRLYRKQFQKEVAVLDAAALPISSTEVRLAIKEGREAPLPASVLDYIKSEGLYR